MGSVTDNIEWWYRALSQADLTGLVGAVGIAGTTHGTYTKRLTIWYLGT